MTMTVEQVKKLVGRRFFEVEFEKADGSIRKMNARIGIRKYVKGTGRPVAAHLVGVWDRQKMAENLKAGMGRWNSGHKAYRSIKVENIRWLKVNGKMYDSEGKEIKE